MYIYVIDDNIFFTKKITEFLRSIDFYPFGEVRIVPVDSTRSFYKNLDIMDIGDNDIFILDIDLKSNFSGIDIGERVREKNNNSYIVFLTSFESKAIEVINKQINPISYITKETALEKTFDSLAATIRVILNEALDRRTTMEYLNMPQRDNNKLIPTNKFLYAESIKSEKTKILLHLDKEQIVISCKLKQFKKLNTTSIFYSGLSSYVLNIQNIKSWSISDENIIFWNKKSLKLSPYSITKVSRYVTRYKEGLIDE
ncbi:response regulator [Enterococcus hulanensis]|uniref:LytR/AlgR family response regulator transcription factor n=1 Tax=Enterococcus hulanensis TaxID=2559929 RepID=UPI001A8E852E|nr:response regulator [Enterococcus hulanensis]MBO0459404.1 response regulator [Enterococcus hulanensis]